MTSFNCVTFFYFILLIFFIHGNDDIKSELSELCPNMLRKVFNQSAPAGDTKSGNFTQYKDVSDLITCVKRCCLKNSNCNVAFIFDDVCYHVKCSTNELCLPKKRNVKGQLQMALVNPVIEYNSSPDSLSSTWMNILKTSKIDEYHEQQQELHQQPPEDDFEKINLWKDNNYRLRNEPLNYDDDQIPITTEKRLNSILKSKLGFDRLGGSDQQFLPEDNVMIPSLDEQQSFSSSINLLSCKLGVDATCRINEECVPYLSKSRSGICHCIEGYKRNKLGKCLRLSDIDFAADTIVEKILNNHGRQPLGADIPSIEIEPEKLIENISTTKPPLKKLAVSVVSKNVRLPEKEVSLAAYTVPDEQSSGDTYKYSWTLISQPNGAVNGTISDQGKDKVKLSNLSEGLFKFKVTVTGNESYGETLANVTVLPEKRINKLPDVIITPKNQTIKPPNSKAILDGSNSIDDDKIISWHWELIQGPIGYQPILKETSTLQLTDLEIPGNYTFKLTVTDSDNKQNSTTANIIVQKVTDYPPEANAGTDVILYLPHNNVTLNGTLSTDDKEIVSWEWTKDAGKEGKAVDMQNTRTPYLQLSNLEEGFYTFELKVMDASNQTSSAKVNVFVKPPTNLPPVANAGINAANEELLKEKFSRYDEIIEVKLKKKYTNYLNRTYFSAYVCFKNPENAADVLLNSKELDSVPLNVINVRHADSWKQPNQDNHFDKFSKISNNDEHFQLHQLNDYCLLHLYSKLSIKDQITLSKLSERLEILLFTYYRSNKSINLESSLVKNLTLMELRTFLINFGENLNEYQRFSSYYDTINTRILKFILQYCSNLIILKISNVSFKDQRFSEQISINYKNMKILELVDCRLNDNDIKNLSTLNQLEILNLSGDINEFTGIYLNNLKNLTSLNLNLCYDLVEFEFIKMIKNFNNLKYLRIQGCSHLRNETFHNLAKYCENLETLLISIYRFDMKLIGNSIGKLKSLKNLTVQNANPRGCTGYFSDNDQLSDFLMILSETNLINQLEILKLPLCKLRNTDYLYIGKFHKLNQLLFGIFGNQIAPNFMIQLQFLNFLNLLCIRLESHYSLQQNFINDIINFIANKQPRKLFTMKIDISKREYEKILMTINLPQTWVILNGSQSTDDIHITNYYWKQISGPNNAIIANSNASIANATSLTIGQYLFELTLSDVNKNTAKDQIAIKVVQEKNSPPNADAGGDQTLTLPLSAIYLNGSKSSDDLAIVKYLWKRDDSSLAFGNIIGESDHQSVLILTNIVPGRYAFTLTVYDDQGLSDTQSVSILINQDPIVMNLVELTLSVGISALTKIEYDSIIQKIGLLLGDVKIRVRELIRDAKSGEAILVFYVEKNKPNGKMNIMSGVEVEKILKEKFWLDATLLGTPFTDARTTICQNKCSYHGLCNSVTRACICETFWMPSVFYFWGVDEANCDWSILYVFVGVFVGFLLLSGIFWGLSCMCRKRTKKPRTRPKIQKKYDLLRTQEDESFNRVTSLTDSETDSDVLFENRTKQNGILRSNGISAKNGSKYPTTRLGRRIKT